VTTTDSDRTRSLRGVCFGVIGLLYLMSVPWYREADAPLVLWLGLPDWVTVAMACYVGVAVVNAVAWLATEVPDEPVPGKGLGISEVQE
jgi:hypothetical protein